MELTERITGIHPSQTLAITSQVLKMKQEGKKVISFGPGEPDFDTPINIQKEAIKAIKNGFTHYTNSSGIPELKQAVVEKLKRDNNLDYTVNEIIISNGAKHALYNALMSLCNPGDEVLIPTPCWVSYTEQIKLVQAKPVFIHTKKEDNFQLLAEQVKKGITGKTKVILLNTPNNPTGAVYDPEELEKISKVLIENNIYCITDEIYEKLVYDEAKHISIASMGDDIKERTILINGVSKSYAMTGWRIGYAAGPEKIISGLAKFQGHCTTNPNSIAQKASVEALIGDQTSIDHMLDEFNKRRKFIIKEINKINGFECDMPKGTFYAFPDITKLLSSGIEFAGDEVTSSLQLANYILNKIEVAVVPGSAFEAEGFLRMSYATSLEEIKEGIKRLKKLFNT